VLWGRYDGTSFVCDALGSERGWGSDRLLGRAFRYLPAASCGEKASWVACRHVELEMRIAARALGVYSGCRRAPAIISARSETCHGLSHSKASPPGRVNVKFANGSHLKYDNYTFGSRASRPFLELRVFRSYSV
jgi:hypothetical protein